MHRSLDSNTAHGDSQRSPVAAWRVQANCLGADPNLFFQERGGYNANWSVRETIQTYCVPCPVRGACLEEGFMEKVGIWGGTTPKERRKLRIGRRHDIRLMKPSDS